MGTESIIGAASSLVGSAVSAVTSIHTTKQQKKAARSAASEAARITDSAIARSTDTAAAQQTNTEATARTNTQNAAKRRMSMASTVNRIGSNGGRLTLN